MSRKFLFATAVAAFGVCGVVQSAQAVQITLGPTADGIGFTAPGGGLVGVSITGGTSGSTLRIRRHLHPGRSKLYRGAECWGIVPRRGEQRAF
jgi:hypothetical protein